MHWLGFGRTLNPPPPPPPASWEVLNLPASAPTQRVGHGFPPQKVDTYVHLEVPAGILVFKQLPCHGSPGCVANHLEEGC